MLSAAIVLYLLIAYYLCIKRVDHLNEESEEWEYSKLWWFYQLDSPSLTALGKLLTTPFKILWNLFWAGCIVLPANIVAMVVWPIVWIIIFYWHVLRYLLFKDVTIDSIPSYKWS